MVILFCSRCRLFWIDSLLCQAYPSLLQRLRNNAYRHPRQRTLKPSDRGTWNFTRKGTEGIRALDALEGNLRDLDGRDDMIFPTEFIKVTFLIDVCS